MLSFWELAEFAWTRCLGWEGVNPDRELAREEGSQEISPLAPHPLAALMKSWLSL
jgi:hypothetical protein